MTVKTIYSLYKGLPAGAKNALQIMSLAAYASETNEHMFHSLRENLCHAEVGDRRYVFSRVRVAVPPRIKLSCVPPDPLEVAGAFLTGFSHMKIMLLSRITLMDQIKTFLCGYIILLVEV